MPYIEIKTGIALTADHRETMTREIGKIITAIPGKNPGNLMLAYIDKVPMAMNGKESPEFLFMDLRLFTPAALEQKKTVIAGCSDLFNKILGIPLENIYVNVIELETWGTRGTLEYKPAQK